MGAIIEDEIEQAVLVRLPYTSHTDIEVCIHRSKTDGGFGPWKVFGWKFMQGDYQLECGPKTKAAVDKYLKEPGFAEGLGMFALERDRALNEPITSLTIEDEPFFKLPKVAQ